MLRQCLRHWPSIEPALVLASACGHRQPIRRCILQSIPVGRTIQKLNLVWDRNSPMIVPTAAFSQTAWERWGISRLHDQLTLKWATTPSGLSCLAGSSIVRQCNLLAAQKSALNLRVQNIMYYPEKWSICIEKENISGWRIIWNYYKKKRRKNKLRKNNYYKIKECTPYFKIITINNLINLHIDLEVMRVRRKPQYRNLFAILINMTGHPCKQTL